MLSDEGFSRAWYWLAVGFHMCVSSSLLGSVWVPAVAERSKKGMIMGVGAWLVALNWNLFSAARDLVGLLRWWSVWVIGLMAAMVVSWRREASRRGFFRYFFRVLFLSFWLGLISLYSFELGFGFIVGPWLWRYSWGQFVSNSVCFCRQFADIRSLHVVWYVLERGVEEGVVFLAVVYEVLSGLSGLFFISSLCGRFLWFKVGSFWLIKIVFNNLHVTNVISRIVRGFPTTRVVGRGYIITCHIHIMYSFRY